MAGPGLGEDPPHRAEGRRQPHRVPRGRGAWPRDPARRGYAQPSPSASFTDDGDGVAEIVALTADNRLAAFEHDLTLKWKSAATVSGAQSSAVGLADVDEDGDVEMVGSRIVSMSRGLYRLVGRVLRLN